MSDKKKPAKKPQAAEPAADDGAVRAEELPELSAERLEEIQQAQQTAEQAVAAAVRGTAEQMLSGRAEDGDGA